MNHGRCENCWWYYQVHGNGYKVGKEGLVEIVGSGVCYMQSKSLFHDLTMVKMMANSYCPDYFNRKRKKGTLEEWLNKMDIPRPELEEFDNIGCS